jgi:hypothetical protein
MLASQTATRRGYKEQFAPSEEITENLRALSVNILEPLRLSVGVPIRVSSGYRCPRLNRAIRGARSSQHVQGQAADISSPGVSNAELLDRIVALNLPFDQLIAEFPDAQGKPSWIHVSYSERHRRQQLTALRIAGKTYYEST